MIPRTVFTLVAAMLLWASPSGAASYDLWKTPNADLDLHDTRGLRLRFDEPDLRFRVGGRFHGDWAVFDDDRSPIDNDADVRRGRAYLSGELFDDWGFKVEYEFSGDDALGTSRGWRNLWLRYKPMARTWIRGGNFVAPFGLQDPASSNHAMFMERSLASALAPAFGTGVELHRHGRAADERRRNHWTATTAIVVEPMGDAEDDRHKSDYWATTTRLTFAPMAYRKRVLHVGASFEYRDLGRGHRYRVRTRPESRLAPALLNTGRFADVDHTLGFGIEAAAVLGPFSAQAEYMRTSLDRDGRRDPEFDGWYLQGSYVLTGESRRYSRSRGTFRGIDPERKWGALEVALRYGALDLVDSGVRGGDARNLSVGLNWYLRENVRLLFNYVRVNARQRTTLRSDDPDIFQFRFMFFL